MLDCQPQPLFHIHSFSIAVERFIHTRTDCLRAYLEEPETLRDLLYAQQALLWAGPNELGTEFIEGLGEFPIPLPHQPFALVRHHYFNVWITIGRRTTADEIRDYIFGELQKELPEIEVESDYTWRNYLEDIGIDWRVSSIPSWLQ